MYSLYIYEFPDGMKYVGITSKKLEERRDSGYQHNKRLMDAIKKCGGWNHFKHYILKFGLTKEEAEELEIKTIKELREQKPGCLYNISSGGFNVFIGLKHTDEEKKKISQANKGRKFSKEHLKKLSESHKGKCIGKDNCNAVRVAQYSLLGEFIAEFETISKAAETVGIDRRGISDCIRGRQKTAGCFHWNRIGKGVV